MRPRCRLPKASSAWPGRSAEPSPPDDPWPARMSPAVRAPTDWRTAMLSYAVIFLVIALIAAVLGFSGIAGAASNIAWILFVVFLVLAAISFFRGKRV